MLDSFDEKGAILKAGPAGALLDVANVGVDGGGFAVLLADENNAGVGVGRRDGDSGWFARKESLAGKGRFAADCFLP